MSIILYRVRAKKMGDYETKIKKSNKNVKINVSRWKLFLYIKCHLRK